MEDKNNCEKEHVVISFSKAPEFTGSDSASILSDIAKKIFDCQSEWNKTTFSFPLKEIEKVVFAHDIYSSENKTREHHYFHSIISLQFMLKQKVIFK